MSIDWKQFGLPDPIGELAHGGHTIYTFDSGLPEYSVLDELHEQGLHGALWAMWNESIDPDDVEEEDLALVGGLKEYKEFIGREYEALAAFGLNPDLSVRAEAEVDEPSVWTDPGDIWEEEIANSQFAVVEASVGQAAMAMSCTACANVLPLGALGHVFDALDTRFGMQLLGLGDQELPNVIVRFPNVDGQREDIVAALSAVADWFDIYEEPNGALQANLCWD